MKKLKFIGKWTGIGIITLISSIVVFFDRLILSPFVWIDLPGIQEINKFDHEKTRLANRTGMYIVISALVVIIEWLTGFFSWLLNLFL